MIYLTPAQVAEELQVSVHTVRDWIEDRKLRAIRTGNQKGRLRISTVALEEFLRQREVLPIGRGYGNPWRPTWKKLRDVNQPAEVGPGIGGTK